MTRGTDKPTTSWYKSSYSNGDGGNCVEVSQPEAGLRVRDSKRPSGPMIDIGASAWGAFIGNLSAEAAIS
jgi:hypothetical protein